MRFLTITAFVVLYCCGLQAQIFGRLERAVDKVTQKVEDRLVEAIADQVYKSLDQTVDSMLYETYTSSGSDSIDYTTFLSGMDAGDRLPVDYRFDVVLDVEIVDGKDRNEMRMLMSTDGQYFGFDQYQEKGKPIMVIDTQNDLIAMYQHDKDGKSVMAMPNMMKRYASAAVEDKLSDPNYKFEKTGKTKNILGYQCDEYRYETEEDKGTGYAASDFPVSWSDAFGASFGQVTAEDHSLISEYMEGMLLISTTTSKKSGKSSTWEVVKVDLDGLTLDNATYSKTLVGSQE